MTGRKFLLHWSARLLRLRWRQQLGVICLITISTAIVVGSIVATYNMLAPSDPVRGKAKVVANYEGDAVEVVQSLDDAGNNFGSRVTATYRPEGSATTIDLIAQKPDQPIVSELVALVAGKLPTTDNEIAITQNLQLAADATTYSVGDVVPVAGKDRTVVGIVENPANLKQDFGLVNEMGSYDLDSRLVVTTIYALDIASEVVFPTESMVGITISDGPPERTIGAILVSVVSGLGFLVVALMVGSSFATTAQKRARQYGLLAAIGATPSQVRSAIVLLGALIGTIASIVGTLLGLGIVAVLVPRLERLVAHRIEFVVPWWTVVPTLGGSILMSIVAAWWPARRISKEPVVSALAALRPRPAATAGSTWLGLIFMVAGAVGAGVGTNRLSSGLIVGGLGIALLGALFLSPGLIRQVGKLGRHLPLKGRMGARMLARQQGRSAAVVAAIAVSVGVPLGIAVTTLSAERFDNEVYAPNLPENKAVLWANGFGGDSPPVVPLDLPELKPSFGDELEEKLPGVSVAPIQAVNRPTLGGTIIDVDEKLVLGMPLDYGVKPANCEQLPECDTLSLGNRDESGREISYESHQVWVATPQVLDLLGLEFGPRSQSDKSDGVSLFEDADLAESVIDKKPMSLEADKSIPPNKTLPQTFLWPETIAAKNLEAVEIGWLVSSELPLTATEIEVLKEAAGLEFRTEVHKPLPAASGLRMISIIVGLAIAAAVLVSAVTVLAAESASDQRVLQSIGASPQLHRGIAAYSAALLAIAGVLVAVPIGYLPLLVLLADSTPAFSFAIPWFSLIAVLIALPTMAALVGWCSSKNHASGLARVTA